MKPIRLVKDPAFYKAFFSIWSVLVLHNIITLGVNLLDNVMVSAYSEAAMALHYSRAQVYRMIVQIENAIGKK